MHPRRFGQTCVRTQFFENDLMCALSVCMRHVYTLTHTRVLSLSLTHSLTALTALALSVLIHFI